MTAFNPKYRQSDIQQLWDTPKDEQQFEMQQEAIKRMLEWLVELHERLDLVEDRDQ